MTKMFYKRERSLELLDKGTYKGYDYLIISYGTHPCCYIHIPKENALYGVDYEEIDLCVHGGLTFGDFFSEESADKLGISHDDWYIGWDYSHYNDYSGYFSQEYWDGLRLRKWTTEMLLDDVRCAIDELKNPPVKLELKPYVWYPCNNATDIELQDNQVRIFYVNETVYEDSDCPYGWNVLERNNAKVMIINKPE